LDAFAYRDREARKCVRSLVAIGRLAEEKSHKTLISAIRLLKERYHSELRPFPKTTIVGDGELRGALDQLIRREGLEQDVLLAGIKNDIPEVLRTHEIYVMSSIWEGLSISLLEAMASGIPVIATDVGSNSEIVDHGVNGLTVPVAAPEILCEAIYRLIKDRELRQRFSLAGPEKASLFSIEECAQRHLCMYQNIASQ
jgi:glycosyltransferase involved in cell wall biosynthesis